MPELSHAADGSGDALTIQDAVDAAPNGGTVEICAGSYSEDVVVDGKDLSIAGSGEMPDDVVWEGAGGAALSVSGGPDVDVSWVTLVGTASNPTVTGDEYGQLALTTIAFSGDVIVWSDSTSSATILSVSRSKVVGSLGVCEYDAGSASVEVIENSVEGALYIFAGGGDESKTIEVSNNVVVGGALWVQLLGYGSYTPYTVEFERNTIVATSVTYVSLSCGEYGHETSYCPDVTISDNIFAESSGEIHWETNWFGLADTSEADLSEWSPSALSGNVIWEVDGGVVVDNFYECTPAYYSYAEPWAVTSSDTSEWTTSSIWEDPQFTVTDAGSYTPDPSGPAADAGAFSGANGDWYKEFAWPLD